MRYLLLSILLYLAMPAHAQQTKVNNAALPDTSKFNSVCRVDSSITWAVADSGRIYRQTTLGWTQIQVEGISVYKLKNVFSLKERSDYVWIVGVNERTKQNVMLKSTSGNRENPRWQCVTAWPLIRNDAFTSIRFDNLINGYIYGPNGILMQSRDGGATWWRVPGGDKQ